MKRKICLISVLLLICSTLFSATITVRNTNDTGDGSLRVALVAANENPGPDVIEFAIPKNDLNYDAENGYWVIPVYSTLPTVTDDSLTIDGFSQHLAAPEAPPEKPLIVISGYGISSVSHGLLFWSAYNSVNSLCIGGFHGVQIWIKGQFAHHNAIQGCYIGVYPDGQSGFADLESPTMAVTESRGVYISQGSHSNQIGGVEEYMHNVISNMYMEAILIDASYDNVIRGNLIGTTADGLSPLGNGWVDVPRYNRDERPIARYPGMAIKGGSSGNIVGGLEVLERNVICASGRAGLRIEGEGSIDNVIIGNFFGLAADGSAGVNLGNAESGIKIMRGANGTQIGSEEPGGGNVVSNNGSSAIQLREDVSNTVIAGNMIGLSPDSLSLVPNEHNGIYLFGQMESGYPQNNQIGPGNVIIANGEESTDAAYAYTWAAVRLDSAGTSMNRIFGNWLNTDKLGNLGSDYNSGVIIGSGAHDNIVGPDNIIAKSAKYGVWVRQKGSDRNTITANLYDENLLGHIYLSDSSNAQIQAPQILSIDSTSVSGTCVPLGKVELYSENGSTFVDSVYADESGDFVWNGDTNGHFFQATVTDPDGNTSEFSEGKAVPVELSLFTATIAERGVLLSWRTESESNNLGFYVQRGNPEFKDIAFIAGHGTTVEPQEYSFLDVGLEFSQARYRLRQVDFDGTVSYSGIVQAITASPESFVLSHPYPNPFNGQTIFRLDVPREARVVISLYNLRGEQVAELFHGVLTSGVHQFSWQGHNHQGAIMPSGLYLLRAVIDQKQILQQKVMFVQ